MKLEQQLVSLELAKKLKELGVKQESYFYWDIHNELFVPLDSTLNPYTQCSAFTVAELGEMLPYGCWTEKMMAGMASYKEGRWRCTDDVNIGSDNKVLKMYADTEADARAKMLIYLVENNLITL